MQAHELVKEESRSPLAVVEDARTERDQRYRAASLSGGRGPGPAPGADEEVRAASFSRSDAELLRRYRLTGDPGAREALVERFLPLARRLARRYRHGAEPLEDLVQVASVGLVKAIDRFDPARGAAFSSYAVPTILGELKRHLRDTSWAVHVPRGLQERAMLVNGTMGRLSRTLGRSPSPAEIAEAIGLSTEAVLEAMEADRAFDTTSLDAPRSADETDGDPISETLGQEESGYELVEDVASIAPALRNLPERDRVVLHLRFVEDMTQLEIARRVGVSQMHVSRLIRRSLERLRDEADAPVSATVTRAT